MSKSGKDVSVDTFNRDAWDKVAEQGDQLFHVASEKQVERARAGSPEIRLAPTKQVPPSWFMPVAGKKILCLAGGGGLQGPILAAAGATVTVADISENQLQRDRAVAERENLTIETMVADMRTADGIPDNSFDLVLNPTSVCYIDDVQPVWQSAYRVLKPGGVLIAGSMNPINFLFDPFARDRGRLKVTNRIPYSDLDLPEEERERLIAPDRPIEFSHTLTTLIGGQIEAGFSIAGFMEDKWGGKDCLSDRIDVFFVTRAVKPS